MNDADPIRINARLAEPTGPRSIRLERLVRGPIERVWTYVVDSDHRRQWLAEGPMELHVGGAVRLTWRNAGLTEHPGAIPPSHAHDPEAHSMTGTITAIDPPRLIAFTWTIGGTPTEVAIELTPDGDRVKLVLTHRALGSVQALVSVSIGWDTHASLLVDLLDGTTPDGFWTRFGAREALYRERQEDDGPVATPIERV